MPLSRVATTCLLVGLSPLIPIPFVDDMVQRAMLREAYGTLARHEGRPCPPAALQALTAGHSNFLVGCLLAMLWWPVKKLFRTIVFVLIVKDCLDEAAQAAVRGLLVHRALQAGLLPDEAPRVRAAMDQAWSAAGRSAAWNLLRRWRGPPADPAHGLLARLLHHLADRAGLPQVTAAFDAALHPPTPAQIAAAPTP